jgi:hypothetical protein
MLLTDPDSDSDESSESEPGRHHDTSTRSSQQASRPGPARTMFGACTTRSRQPGVIRVGRGLGLAPSKDGPGWRGCRFTLQQGHPTTRSRQPAGRPPPASRWSRGASWGVASRERLRRAAAPGLTVRPPRNAHTAGPRAGLQWSGAAAGAGAGGEAGGFRGGGGRRGWCAGSRRRRPRRPRRGAPWRAPRR